MKKTTRKTHTATATSPKAIPAAIVAAGPVPTPSLTMTDMIAALHSLGLRIVPGAGAEQPKPNTLPIMSGPRVLYSVPKNPVPPFGESALAVFEWLKAHPHASQGDLETGTGMTEGQIKGAIRQLALAGYVVKERAEQ